MNAGSIPLHDPTPDLSPTAGRLIEAARRILVREGLSSVTYEAVAKESGETQSLIRYHFGDKASFVRTLIESELYLECRDIMTAVAEAPPGPQRYHALLREIEKDAHEVEEYRAFLDVVAEILRDEALRPLFTAFVDWYVDLNRWVLASFSDGHSRDDLESLATLTYAVAEGLAVRCQAGHDVDVRAALRVWEAMVCDYMDAQCSTTAGADGPRAGRPVA